MLWWMVAVALACPKPRMLTGRPAVPVSMRPALTLDAPIRHRVDPTLAAVQPVVLPIEPDAVTARGLRFGAWHWDARTGSGTYAPLAGPSAGEWHWLGRWREDETGAFAPRDEDRVKGLTFAVGEAQFAVRTHGVYAHTATGIAPVWAPKTGRVHAAWASPLGRFLLVAGEDELVAIDGATGEHVDQRDLGIRDPSGFVADAWTGEILDKEWASRVEPKEWLRAALGCDELPRTWAGQAPGCALFAVEAELDVGLPTEVYDGDGRLVTALAPLAPTCFDQGDGELTVRAAGRLRTYDIRTGALLTDDDNELATWLTSAQAALVDGQPQRVGRVRRPGVELQVGTCGERAEAERLRVWTFADGTWVSLTDDGRVQGTQLAGHLGWLDGDRFVPLLPPHAALPEPEPDSGLMLKAGGSTWLLLGLLAMVRTRIGRPT